MRWRGTGDDFGGFSRVFKRVFDLSTVKDR